MIIKRTDTLLTVMDKNGVIKKVRLASDKQMDYLNSLRVELGRLPLKSRLPSWKASRQIDLLIKRLAAREAERNQRAARQTLF